MPGTSEGARHLCTSNPVKQVTIVEKRYSNPKDNEMSESSESRMPIELSKVFDALSNELAWAYAKFNTYKQIYNSGEDTLETIYDSAWDFFLMLDRMLVDDIVLTICRMTTDKLKINGQDNLVLERLWFVIPAGDQSDDFWSSIKSDVQGIYACADDLRKWRIKLIAHNDLKTILAQQSTELPELSLNVISNLLKSISDLLNKVNAHYNDSEIFFEPHMRQDASSLVFYLREGLAYQKFKDDNLIF